jgi:hypothetical protein
MEDYRSFWWEKKKMRGVQPVLVGFTFSLRLASLLSLLVLS